MIFETKRLVLRPWQISDADSLYYYAKDPDVGPNCGWKPHDNIKESLYVIEHGLNHMHDFAICLNKDHIAIGSISLILHKHSTLTNNENECELGFWLGKPFWNQGLMSEAAKELIRYGFMDLGMDIIWCGYYDGNDKSKRIQEKLGFCYHHTNHNVEIPVLNEMRTEHINYLKKSDWLRQ